MSSILFTPASTFTTYWWEIKIFNRFGVELATVLEATNKQLSFPLNGIDNCQFSMYLDDPLIDPTQGGDPTIIRTMDRTVKVWRHISDPVNGIFYDAPSSTPDFAGPITRVEKTGNGNMVNIIAQNPLWRLQSRFHILNHYLVIDYVGQNISPNYQGGNMDSQPWDISALMFRLIDLINGAFGTSSQTGIIKPPPIAPNLYWTKTVQMGPFSIAKGDNTWTRFNELLTLPSAPDIYPQYIDDGTSDLMYFKTAPVRGNDKSSTVSYDYFTGNANLDDIGVVDEVVPDQFANFVWAVGQGSFNTAVKQATDSSHSFGPENPQPNNISNDAQAIENMGIYMTVVQTETVDVAPGGLLEQVANAELLAVSKRPVTYTITPSTLIPPYFGVHFFVGDLISLNANKRALQISGAKQRVYQVDIALTDNLTENYSITLTDDLYNQISGSSQAGINIPPAPASPTPSTSPASPPIGGGGPGGGGASSSITSASVSGYPAVGNTLVAVVS